MAFFNFNIENDAVVNAQIDVLKKKYRKWAKDSGGLDCERKVRTYLVEALAAYGDPIPKNHPGIEVLRKYRKWLADRGYKIHSDDAGVIVTSARNTYVKKARQAINDSMPECVGLLNIILANKGEVLGD